MLQNKNDNLRNVIKCTFEKNKIIRNKYVKYSKNIKKEI